MADKVFSGTIALCDKAIDEGCVLASDGEARAVGSGAPPDGEKPPGGASAPFNRMARTA